MMRGNTRYLILTFAMLVLTVSVPALRGAAVPQLPGGYDAGSSRNQVFERANSYYRDGELERALSGYLYLTDLGLANGYIYYNIGNTYFRLGDIGKAILWYERAKRYLPRFADLDFNLNYARNSLVDEEFRQQDYGGTVGFFLTLHEYLNLRESLVLLAVLIWLLTAAACGRMLVANEKLKGWFNACCWTFGIAVALGILSTGYKIYCFNTVQEAVISATALEVKTGPGGNFSTVFSLHEGTKVRVLKQQDDWTQIVLTGVSGFTGWVPTDTIETI